MNNKGFTVTELLATIVIIIVILLIVTPLIVSVSQEGKSCGYHYTDANGQQGVATYCSTSYNVLKCSDGWNKQIQVVEYEYKCD